MNGSSDEVDEGPFDYSSRALGRRLLRYQVGEEGYHALMGEYLTTWMEFEVVLNWMLARWFAPANDADHFANEVVPAISLQRRLRLLRRVCDQIGIADAKELNDALSAAYDMRNKMAHHPAGPDPADPTRILFGKSRQPTTQVELHDGLLALASAAQTILATVVSAMVDAKILPLPHVE
jgi:hypothetical protein